MSFDNAYESLIDGHEDAHWAFSMRRASRWFSLT